MLSRRRGHEFSGLALSNSINQVEKGRFTSPYQDATSWEDDTIEVSWEGEMND